MAAVIGVGVLNVTIALSILGIPPILTNAFTGIRQADRASVEAARGIGMTELEILTRVEMPLAIPTLMAGVRGPRSRSWRRRRSRRWPGSLTLGDYIINENVYGENGVLAGAIVVALMALALEFGLAGLQRLITSKGLKLSAA